MRVSLVKAIAGKTAALVAANIDDILVLPQ
jgi:hypothetical protein